MGNPHPRTDDEEPLVSVSPVPPGRAAPNHPEFHKRIWDVRNIAGAHYADHCSDHKLNFTQIPDAFEFDLRLFIWWLLTTRSQSQSQCARLIEGIGAFLRFFVGCYPEEGTLRNLSSLQLDTFKNHLQSELNRYGRQRSIGDIWRKISAVEYFLRFLCRTDSPIAPALDVDKIVWPEHKGRKPQHDPNQVKYIPQTVLAQLDRHVDGLKKEYLPVVLLLRASGWRISDALNLRWDTCLQRNEKGWFLCGDIKKTQVLGHKVPISAEVAAMIQVQIQQVREKRSDVENPSRYLFPGITRKRAARPISGQRVNEALQRLAREREIRDLKGEIFHFTSHAFRHTKAVELINNGMPLVYVQQWMAHLTPSMTQIYARILDETMRVKWEEAMASGVFRLSPTGVPEAFDPNQVVGENELELEHIRHNLLALRLANGYCFKPKSMNCPAAELPCSNCHAFVTTPEFLPQFERELADTQELAAIHEQAGHTMGAEANRKKLPRLVAWVGMLREGKTIAGMPKAQREYIQDERQPCAADGKSYSDE